MAINKEQSPLWVRIVVVVLVLGLVAGIGILTVGSVIQTWTGSSGANYQNLTPEQAEAVISQIDEKYQAEVDAAQAKVDANSEDKDALTALATAYYNWAAELAQINDENAQGMVFSHLIMSLQAWQQVATLDPEDQTAQQMIQNIQGMMGSPLGADGQPQE